MKKIFWLIQQTKKAGGTELVTIQIANRLVSTYDITLVVSGEKPEVNNYNIDPRIKIIYLGIKEQHIKFDETVVALRDKRKYFQILIKTFETIFFWIFKRGHYRRILKGLTKEEDLIIASSLDNYIFSPKKRTVYYHIHFNSKFFLSLGNRLTMALCARKADKYIFLAKSSLEAVKKHYPKMICEWNTNICRFNKEAHFNYQGSNLLFVGRYAEQKRPLLLLEAINELKRRNVKFHLDLYGNGPLKDLMEKYVNINDLHQEVTIHDQNKDIKGVLNSHDLFLLTSSYEGYALVIQEATSQSVPTISMDWGEPIEEIINEGVNGYITKDGDIYDFADKIQLVLNDLNSLKRLKETTYEFAGTYDEKAIIDKWIKIIEDK
ncbi:MAG: glycosyltransferase [Erysipelotrichaceae bacterium]|jgi:glycosyltransferase involved in cell wall biosynthesis|nr:glycosyltransferase [Erysipelotrichaceae bacterium]